MQVLQQYFTAPQAAASEQGAAVTDDGCFVSSIRSRPLYERVAS
jgi:hypothetical protein